MTLTAVEDLVRARIGLDPGSLGASTFARTVTARMRARGTNSAAAYAGLLASDPAEWVALVEELVVPESWFFRGGAAYFHQLARWARERATSGRPVRLLSAPCGSGEEPYSLAIALGEEGIPAGLARIEAVDLSGDNIRRAEVGTYPAFAFRETGIDPRPRYFRETGPGRWELDHRTRETVRFRTGNLTDPAFLVGERAFDLILCRNLFIYLTDEARGRAVANLHRLLVPGGRLYLTPPEADRLPPDQFASDGPAVLAVFRRADDPAPAVSPQARIVRRPVVTRRPGAVPGPAPSVQRPTRQEPPRAPEMRSDRPPPAADVGAARVLADAGNLAEARAVCERAVRAGPTAEWYSLLGVLELATGRVPAAEVAFRRALYLDPDHREALTHLAVLCDRRGEPGPAAGLRRRLARLPGETA
ncbi:MAG TPA: CheR family methyltransferase [Urbifossiella sp.]|jgi:chemotaxis protein methyltransferase WspC|nr:CheR family methyltransferase [Urbifossiella sp.]